MIKNYALVQDGLVLNVIRWDQDDQPDFDYGKDSGVEAIESTSDNPAAPGYLYSDGVFSAPPLTDEEKAELNTQLIRNNVAQKDALMTEATQRRDTLQDAVDLGEATDEETAALPLWKKYRILLSRVDANTSETVTWPDKPSS